jgi:hypothetical protein
VQRLDEAVQLGGGKKFRRNIGRRSRRGTAAVGAARRAGVRAPVAERHLVDERAHFHQRRLGGEHLAVDESGPGPGEARPDGPQVLAGGAQVGDLGG